LNCDLELAWMNKKTNFNRNIPWLKGSQSQLGQESFVAFALSNKKSGYYLEIGAYHAQILSNTFILERDFGWKGVGLEIDADRVNAYNQQRANKALLIDATKANYETLLNSIGAPRCIDFLQVDIEPPRNSYLALKGALNSSRKFQVVTFEHDLYRKKFRMIPLNIIWKLAAHIKLLLNGYVRVISDVSNDWRKQEDWYIHMNSGGLNFEKLKNIDFRELFFFP